MPKKINVLHFVDRLLLGGIQKFILNYILHFDRNKFNVSILVLDDGNSYPLEQRFQVMGVQVYKLPQVWLHTLRDIIPYVYAVDNFFSSHKGYDVLHYHSSSKNAYIMYAAKKYGIRMRIAHSHSTGFQTSNKFHIAVGRMLKYCLRKNATRYFSCSCLAGEWMFGKREMQKGNVIVVNNAIDTQLFSFSEKVRTSVRKELQIEERYVLGHVGRFSKVKNHSFLIDLFFQVAKTKLDAVLLLIGEGELEPDIRQKVHQLGLGEQVFFLGVRDDVHRLLQAMDIFLLPSLYEGLGIVLIEAQAAGLPVICSDRVPDEACLTKQFHKISLNSNIDEWVKKIEAVKKDSNASRGAVADIVRKSYDIHAVVDTLQKMYEGMKRQI